MCLRRGGSDVGQRTARLCRKYLENVRILPGIAAGLHAGNYRRRLKRRVSGIMNQCGARRLSAGRKFALIAVGIGTDAVPVFFGLMNTPAVTANGMAAKSLIAFGYDAKELQISGGPGSQLAIGEYECQVTVLDPTGRKAAFWQARVVIVP